MKIQKLLTAILATLLLVGIVGSVARAFPGDQASLYITPATTTWNTNANSVGSTFSVNLNIANLTTGMAGYQFQIDWNNTILNLVSIKDFVPIGGAVFVAQNSTSAGAMQFTVISTSSPLTTVTLGLATIRTIVFKVVLAPPHTLGGSITSPISIANDILSTASATPISHYTGSGAFIFNFVPPNPPSITAGSATLNAPGPVSIPVTISNYDPVYNMLSATFKLTFSPTLLQVTGVTGGFLGSPVVTDTIDNVGGSVIVTVTGTAPTTSSGVVATIAFNAITGTPGVILTSPLTLVTSSFNSPPTSFYTVTNGLFTMAVPSPAEKAIGVGSYAANDEGEFFTVPVTIYNITSTDMLFGLQFDLQYNPSLLTLVSVTEGPFLPLFNTTTPASSSTYFFVYDYATYFTVATGLLGPVPSPYTYPNTPTPSSTVGGVVAYVTFQTLAGIPGSTVSCPLTLANVIFGDVHGNPIVSGPPNPPIVFTINGLYSLTLAKQYIDVFTNYPAPYGGQLRFHDADEYMPQSLVTLYAYVTYNGYPVMNKPVAFEIEGPPNNTYNITLYATAFTNESGYAEYQFRVEWPDFANVQSVMGIWTVVGRVDIDQVQVYDLLHFSVGWLVQVTKVTTDFASYNHGWYPTITVNYQVISAQTQNAFFTVSLYDEVGNGMGSMVIQTTVASPGIMMTGYGTITFFGFQIPMWARAGVGTVTANAFTADPTYANGTPWCPQVSTTFIINPV